MNDVIFLGGSVKALGGGKVAGYLIQYSTAETPDLSAEKDFFTADCDYDLDTGNRKSVFYSHGLDAKMGVKRIGVGEVKRDEVGVWIEAQLNIRDSYEQAIYKMAEEGKLGWSSGAPSHLVTRKAIKTGTGTAHEILSWPLAEASLTPCPADHRNQAVAFKSLPAMLGMDNTDDAEPGVEPDTTTETTEEIKTATPPASVPFDAQIDAALAAVDGVIQRGFDINDLRIKSGRVLSAANRSKLADLHGKMQQTHGEMTAHLEAINNLLLSTDPDKAKRDATKEADEVAHLRMQHLRRQSRALGVAI